MSRAQVYHNYVLTTVCYTAHTGYMRPGLFTFADALHSHISIGFVQGCVACAQVETDMALSREVYLAGLVTAGAVDENTGAVLVDFPAPAASGVSGNPHRIGLMHTA